METQPVTPSPKRRRHGGRRTPPGGRPTIFSKTLAETLLNAMRAGTYMEQAAEYAGVKREAIYRWLREGDAALDRAQAIITDRTRQAQAIAEDNARRVAAHGKRKGKVALRPLPEIPPSDTPWVVLDHPVDRDLAWFSHAWRRAVHQAEMTMLLHINKAAAKDGRLALEFLSRRHPERYGRKRLELSGPGGGPIEGKVSFYLPVNGREVEAAGGGDEVDAAYEGGE